MSVFVFEELTNTSSISSTLQFFISVHSPKVQFRSTTANYNNPYRYLSITNEELLYDRCRGSARESGKGVTLDHVIAASEGRGYANSGEGLAVG